MSSTIVVTYDGIDISDHVLFESARFTVNANAQPGDFEFTVKDPDGLYSFVTGKEVTLSIDGHLTFGGFLMQVNRTFAFPDKTEGARFYVLRGVDYNILFDKLIIRNTDNYLKALPYPPATAMDGAALRTLLTDYSDFDDTAFTVSSDYLQDVAYFGDGVSIAAYRAQGSKLREQFDDCSFRSGAVYYIAADKRVYYTALEDSTSSWGFSDAPNGTTTRKMHELTAVEDGSLIVNDAMIWGGSQWAGTSGGTVFGRVEDDTSIATHGRWQMSETHFGEEWYGIQTSVDRRAQLIVNGPPGIGIGISGDMEQKGLRFPQWTFNFSWWLHDVPNVPIPGDLYTIDVSAFGETKLLPLRSMTLTFPGLDTQGKAYVLMVGEFSLLLNDPYSLWSYIRANSKKLTNMVIGTATNDSDTTVYGAYGSFTPTLVSGLLYEIKFGYIPGTLMVYDNGLLLTPGTDFTETDSIAGRFTLAASPTGALYVTCRTLAS